MIAAGLLLSILTAAPASFVPRLQAAFHPAFADQGAVPATSNAALDASRPAAAVLDPALAASALEALRLIDVVPSAMAEGWSSGASVSRAQLAEVALRARGTKRTPRLPLRRRFADVPPRSPAAAWIEAAAAQGFMLGTGATTFSPGEPTTRLQSVMVMLRLLGRAADLEGAEASAVVSRARGIGLLADLDGLDDQSAEYWAAPVQPAEFALLVANAVFRVENERTRRTLSETVHRIGTALWVGLTPVGRGNDPPEAVSAVFPGEYQLVGRVLDWGGRELRGRVSWRVEGPASLSSRGVLTVRVPGAGEGSVRVTATAAPLSRELAWPVGRGLEIDASSRFLPPGSPVGLVAYALLADGGRLAIPARWRVVEGAARLVPLGAGADRASPESGADAAAEPGAADTPDGTAVGPTDPVEEATLRATGPGAVAVEAAVLGRSAIETLLSLVGATIEVADAPATEGGEPASALLASDSPLAVGVRIAGLGRVADGPEVEWRVVDRPAPDGTLLAAFTGLLTGSSPDLAGAQTLQVWRGPVEIEARLRDASGGLLATFRRTVERIERLTLDPPSLRLRVTEQGDVRARGWTADGRWFAVEPVWSVSPGLGRVEAGVLLPAGAGAGRLTANWRGLAASAPLTVLGAPARIELVPARAELAANGLAETEVLARVLDEAGQPTDVAADYLFLFADEVTGGGPVGPGASDFIVRLSASRLPLVAGEARLTVTAGRRAGTAQLTAYLPNSTVPAGQVNLTLTPPVPEQIILSADPPVLASDGVSQATVTASLLDREGAEIANPWPNPIQVALRLTSGAGSPSGWLSTSTVSIPTGASAATSRLTAFRQPGHADLAGSATVNVAPQGGVSQIVSLPVRPLVVPMVEVGPAARLAILPPEATVADGRSEMRVRVEVRDAAGNLRTSDSGYSVRLTVTGPAPPLGPSGSGAPTPRSDFSGGSAPPEDLPVARLTAAVSGGRADFALRSSRSGVVALSAEVLGGYWPSGVPVPAAASATWLTGPPARLALSVEPSPLLLDGVVSLAARAPAGGVPTPGGGAGGPATGTAPSSSAAGDLESVDVTLVARLTDEAGNPVSLDGAVVTFQRGPAGPGVTETVLGGRSDASAVGDGRVRVALRGGEARLGLRAGATAGAETWQATAEGWLASAPVEVRVQVTKPATRLAVDPIANPVAAGRTLEVVVRAVDPDGRTDTRLNDVPVEVLVLEPGRADWRAAPGRLRSGVASIPVSFTTASTAVASMSTAVVGAPAWAADLSRAVILARLAPGAAHSDGRPLATEEWLLADATGRSTAVQPGPPASWRAEVTGIDGRPLNRPATGALDLASGGRSAEIRLVPVDTYGNPASFASDAPSALVTPPALQLSGPSGVGWLAGGGTTWTLRSGSQEGTLVVAATVAGSPDGPLPVQPLTVRVFQPVAPWRVLVASDWAGSAAASSGGAGFQSAEGRALAGRPVRVVLRLVDGLDRQLTHVNSGDLIRLRDAGITPAPGASEYAALSRAGFALVDAAGLAATGTIVSTGPSTGLPPELLGLPPGAAGQAPDGRAYGAAEWRGGEAMAVVVSTRAGRIVALPYSYLGASSLPIEVAGVTGASASRAQAAIDYHPAPASALALSASPAFVLVGARSEVTVSARLVDAFGNVDTDAVQAGRLVENDVRFVDWSQPLGETSLSQAGVFSWTGWVRGAASAGTPAEGGVVKLSAATLTGLSAETPLTIDLLPGLPQVVIKPAGGAAGPFPSIAPDVRAVEVDITLPKRFSDQEAGVFLGDRPLALYPTAASAAGDAPDSAAERAVLPAGQERLTVYLRRSDLGGPGVVRLRVLVTSPVGTGPLSPSLTLELR